MILLPHYVVIPDVPCCTHPERKKKQSEAEEGPGRKQKGEKGPTYRISIIFSPPCFPLSLFTCACHATHVPTTQSVAQVKLAAQKL